MILDKSTGKVLITCVDIGAVIVSAPLCRKHCVVQKEQDSPISLHRLDLPS